MKGQDVDALMLQLGTGPWNVIHFITVGFGASIPVSHGLAGVFWSPKVGYTCRPPPLDEPLHLFLPNGTSESSCSYFVEDGGTGEVWEERCTEWDFDNSTFSSTVTGDYGLVCSEEYLRSIYQSMYMFGVFVGSPINGVLADRYGRRPAVVGGSLIFTVIAIGSVWLKSFSTILTARFLVGLTHSTLLKTAYILALEVSSPKVRYIVGSWILCPWAINTAILGGVAYLVRDWRTLQLIMSLMGILHLPGLWYLDESPRWLAVVGKYDQALKVLKRAARWNKVTLPSDEKVLAMLQTGMAKEHTRVRTRLPLGLRIKKALYGGLILFRTPRLRKTTMVAYLTYLVVAMVYFGISLSGSNLSSDPFLYLALMGVVEVLPPSIMMVIMLRLLGRRWCTAVNFLASGVLLLILAFVPSDIQWLVMVLAMVGKVTITTAFGSLNMFASELFPTEVRTRGISTSFMMSRVGAMAAPFIADLLGSLFTWAPPLLMGGASVVAALAILTLNETLGTPLPDTVEALEAQETHKWTLRSFFRLPARDLETHPQGDDPEDTALTTSRDLREGKREEAEEEGLREKKEEEEGIL